jgi:tetratricopeptide (TPR) repeat protein
VIARLRTALCLGAIAIAGCAGQPQATSSPAPAGLPTHVDLDETPFFPQRDDQCGPAALATALGAAGIVVTPDDLIDEVYLPGRRGSLQPEVAAAARARGRMPYELPQTLDAVLAEVAAGRPVLVLQKLGAGPWPGWHYAVVVGYDLAAGTFILRSGTERRASESRRMFDAAWSRGGRWAVVLLEPGELPVAPELVRYMQAAAAFEAVGRTDDAGRAYQAAARQWPSAALPQLGLANLAAARGDWATAERGYRSAAQLEPDNASALNNHAEALLHIGCPVSARREIERARQAAGAGPLAAAVAATERSIAAASAVDGPACPSGS